MSEKTLVRLRFEIEQVDLLLDSYADLIASVRFDAPGLIETTALASVLHSFYNGLEAIFHTIAQEIDQELPEGGRWHRDLLLQMAKSTTFRSAVLSQDTIHNLIEYLAFRHFYRHSYSFYLDWDEMKQQVLSVFTVWGLVKAELRSFMNSWAQE